VNDLGPEFENGGKGSPIRGESRQDRKKRIADIQDRVRRGTYQVPATDVAAALVAFFSRDPGVTSPQLPWPGRCSW